MPSSNAWLPWFRVKSQDQCLIPQLEILIPQLGDPAPGGLACWIYISCTDHQPDWLPQSDLSWLAALESNSVDKFWLHSQVRLHISPFHHILNLHLSSQLTVVSTWVGVHWETPEIWPHPYVMDLPKNIKLASHFDPTRFEPKALRVRSLSPSLSTAEHTRRQGRRGFSTMTFQD